ncbi:MAG: aminoacyl-histidine dipeptidase [Butyrivibrio sp.]|nr:aminoacyl-histidine dipeptidase [Butyrivibrio sp.]
MAVLQEIEPKEVFHFFEEICNIPHGSKNLEQISNYLVSFAQDRQLEVICDGELNVIIKAPASKGYEDMEPVILQGHMDMVAVKEDDCDIDMANEGLRLKTDGEYIWADGTSLGGDDGIAVAYILALLDSKDIPHPPLEVIITTNEEIGMIGATALDLSGLNGKKMINIDNEEEGVFITSCAGGATFHSELPIKRESRSGIECKIEVSGLQGGHSGEMIKHERGNADILCARALYEAMENTELYIKELNGGAADNAIPFAATATVIVSESNLAKIKDSIAKTDRNVKDELGTKDPNAAVTLTEIGEATADCLDKVSAEKMVKMIVSMPNGVLAMSADVEGLVETSVNIGIVCTSEDKAVVVQSLRSSVGSSKEHLKNRLKIVAEAFGASTYITGDYPGWKYRRESGLRDHMVSVYKEMYGKEPTLEAIHAGLECGIISSKIEGLDCISIGPDMADIHSTKEKLSVKSSKNVWEYLKAVLGKR